jgi:S-DNA-T family DNA segregation ATPase FtsK/SpoIIIE
MERELRIRVGGREFAARVRAGARATVADLAAAVGGSGQRAWLTGRRPASPDGALPTAEHLAANRALAEVPVATGGVLAFGRPPVPAHQLTNALELSVVGGAGGAARTSLAVGAMATVGRAPSSDLALPDPEVSRVHASVLVSDDNGVVIGDAGSRNGVGLRGRRVGEPAPVALGEPFSVGETVLAVRVPDAADAPLEPVTPDGTVYYNRPPRVPLRLDVPQWIVPGRPEAPRLARFPFVIVLVPLAMAGVMYWMFPRAGYFLIFLALSPVLLLATAIADRRSGRREYRTDLREYERQRADLVERLTALAVEQGNASREATPDPARLLRIATAPSRRLYERRPADDDFLRLRIGLVSVPVNVELTAEFEVPTIEHAPATVDLASAGVLGLAGPRGALLATARAVLANLAVLHAPHDLGIVVLTGADEAEDWTWVSWLPHTVPHTPDLACQRMVATDAEQVRARLAELRRFVDDRHAERQAALRAAVPAGRRLVVVADGARRLRGLPGLAELLADGPAAGVYAICLDVNETDLPGECGATAVITSGSGTRARLRHTGGGSLDAVLLDRLGAADASTLGFALAPLRVLGGRALGAAAELPDSVRLLDLVALGDEPSPLEIERRWSVGLGTSVTLGVAADRPFAIDLRRDGPHMLVAGTSGAGKSELLQTLVAGLALGNGPDALAVVLVDYKGGSAFAECRQLPHCAGMVTDLDGHLVARALASLSAELRRREALLAEVEAKDIEEYGRVAAKPLPRLVIVIDEFASLVEEVPEFVTGIVGIGMRGRSLGVHVVLATQRPAGVVNAELRANLNLRVCLRVTSASESSDVVDVPDAARLSRHRPGRAYLRAGHGDLTLLQTARIGWPRRVAHADEIVVEVAQRSVRELGAPPAAPPAQDVEDTTETDLSVLVRAVCDAATLAGIAPSPSPWLPPLPEVVVLPEILERLGRPSDPSRPRSVIGLADLPAAQAQRPFVLDLPAAGVVLVAGMARSGRSTVLRAVAASLAAHHGPADVHLYVLDQGNRALAGLAALPHCGAYVDGDDVDRTARVFAFLAAEIARREHLLADGGSNLPAVAAPDGYSLPAVAAPDGFNLPAGAAPEGSKPLPCLLLLLDRYEAFVARYGELDGGRLVDAFDGLLRRGPAVGLVTVLSTDRSGFTHRLAGAVATRLVLAHADRDDLAAYGINPREAPTSMPPGRAIAMAAGAEGVAVQVALLDADPGGAAQAAALDRLCASARSRWPGPNGVRRVDALPAVIAPAEIEALRDQPRPPSPVAVTVGVGGDHLGPVDLDLAELGNAFLVAGPPRSGRSGALLTIAQSLRDVPVVALCPRRSPLRDLPNAAAVLGDDIAELDPLLAELGTPVAVLVDDAELLADGPAALALEAYLRRVRDTGSLLVAAGTTDDLQAQRYRGWLAALRRVRAGLLLNPLSHVDGELFDLRLPRSTAGGWPPGRGLLVTHGRYSAVQVPLHEMVSSIPRRKA